MELAMAGPEKIRKLAQSGDAEAQDRLEDCFKYGIGGGAKNHAAAVTWYGKAAEQGHAQAQAALERLNA